MNVQQQYIFLVRKINIKTFYEYENTLNNINILDNYWETSSDKYVPRAAASNRTPSLRSFVKIYGVGSCYFRLMIRSACPTQSALSIEKCNKSSSNTYIYYLFYKYCNEKLKIRDVPLSGSKDCGRDSHS